MVVTATIERPLVDGMARRAGREGFGLANRLGQAVGLGQIGRALVAGLLLDLSLWLWHRLSHEVAALWSLHRLHHQDRELTLSTAVRFSALELAVSVPYRILQTALIGPSPYALYAWRRITQASVLMHHAGLALPVPVETCLSRLVVTPGLHAVHHGDRPRQAFSNYGALLSVWDQLFGVFRPKVGSGPVRIGVAEDV